MHSSWEARRCRVEIPLTPVVELDICSWRPDISAAEGERHARVLESGGVLVLPKLAFAMRVGEPFEVMAQQLLPTVRPMRAWEPAVLASLRVTKGMRSEYDHLMLGLHDRAKADAGYQARCAQREIRFAPGTTWLCYSDQVMHAAMSGQFMLEQTIHLPLAAMYEPARAPLAILERVAGRALAPRVVA